MTNRVLTWRKVAGRACVAAALALGMTSVATQPAEATAGCRTVTGTKTAYTVLGFVAYKFHLTVSFCYNGSQVTKVNANYWSISQVDALQYWRGIQNQYSVWINNNTSYRSYKQGRFENCVLRYGCIGTTYPSVTITVDKNGGYSIATAG